MLLKHIIQHKRIVPQPIIQVEFRVHPFFPEVIFRLVSYIEPGPSMTMALGKGGTLTLHSTPRSALLQIAPQIVHKVSS